MVQLVLIQCGYSTKGGSTPSLEGNAFHRLLMQVPTPPRDIDGQYPPFPMLGDPLKDWVAYYETEDEEDEEDEDDEEDEEHDEFESDPDEAIARNVNPTPQTEVLEQQQVQFKDLEESDYGLSSHKLQQVIRHSNAEIVKDTKTISDALAVAEIEPLPVPHRIDVASIPTALVYAPALTPTDYALVTGNNIAKIAIAMELATQEQAAWFSLHESCKRKISDWDIKIGMLAEQQRAIDLLKGACESGMSVLADRARTIDAQEDHIKRFCDHPSKRALLQLEVARNRERDSMLESFSSIPTSSQFNLTNQTPHGSPSVAPFKPSYHPL